MSGVSALEVVSAPVIYAQCRENALDLLRSSYTYPRRLKIRLRPSCSRWHRDQLLSCVHAPCASEPKKYAAVHTNS